MTLMLKHVLSAAALLAVANSPAMTADISVFSSGAPSAVLKVLAEDLRHPHFRVSLRLALIRRLRRNYVWMFAILLLAWILKIASPKLQEGTASADTARPIATIVANAALGPIPGWAVIAVVALLYAAMVAGLVSQRRRPNEDEVRV